MTFVHVHCTSLKKSLNQSSSCDSQEPLFLCVNLFANYTSIINVCLQFSLYKTRSNESFIVWSTPFVPLLLRDLHCKSILDGLESHKMVEKRKRLFLLIVIVQKGVASCSCNMCLKTK